MTSGASAFFFTLASILPTMAEGQQPAPQQVAAVPSPSVRPVAPPAAREVPPGSASTSPNQRRTMEAVRMADTESDHVGRTAR